MSSFLSGPRLILLVCLLMTGCATLDENGNNANDAGTIDAATDQQIGQAQDSSKAPANDTIENPDPWEGFNRAMYAFNDGLDDYILKPVAKGYKFILPEIIRTGIANFFSNLFEPTVMINNLLQGKFLQAVSDTGRFLVNTTFGLAGVIDVATHMELEKHDEDFGQTLGVWGVGDGPFVIWPFLGPKNLRDTVGWTGDWITSPITHVRPVSVSWGAWTLEKIDTRANFLGAKDVLEEAASGDPYIFLREAYKQQRRYKIYDGDPPVVEDAEFDALLFGDDDVKK